MVRRLRTERGGDRVWQRLQKNVADALDGAASTTRESAPTGQLIKDVVLADGNTNVVHGLGRPIQGWELRSPRLSTWPTISTGGGDAITIRQQVGGQTAIGASSKVLTLPLTPKDGSTLVLCAGGQLDTAFTSVTQTGATWSSQAEVQAGGGSDRSIKVWTAQNVSSAATGITISWTVGASPNGRLAFLVFELEGALQSGTLITDSGSDTTTWSATLDRYESPTITPGDGEYVLWMWMDQLPPEPIFPSDNYRIIGHENTVGVECIAVGGQFFSEGRSTKVHFSSPDGKGVEGIMWIGSFDAQGSGGGGSAEAAWAVTEVSRSTSVLVLKSNAAATVDLWVY